MITNQQYEKLCELKEALLEAQAQLHAAAGTPDLVAAARNFASIDDELESVLVSLVE